MNADHRRDSSPSPNAVGSEGDVTPAVSSSETFPAKTHSLISYLTEADPQVATFSADGASFEVFDQTTLSHKYLPQWFKHNNWGSFVRQLNLYGFTSSRLKEQSDVIVWNHEMFHRDHRELLRNIKRPKKKKSSVKHSPSPCDQSVVDNHDSQTSPPSLKLLNDDHKEGANLSTADREWLNAQFAKVSLQNRQLEEKIDFLIKQTFHVDEGYSGSKRARTEPQWNASNVAPTPLRGQSSRQYSQGSDEFKSFMDMMMGENSVEGGKAKDEYSQEAYSQPAPAVHHRDPYDRDTYSAVASVVHSLDSGSGNINYAEQFAPPPQHANTAYPPVTYPPSITHRPQYMPPPATTEWVPRTNRNSEKMDGPSLIPSSENVPPVMSCPSDTSEAQDKVPEWVAVVPPSRSASIVIPNATTEDLEQGSHSPFMDMTLVSAHLVESIRSNAAQETTAELIKEQQRHTRLLSKRVLSAIVVLATAAVVSFTSTVMVTQHEAKHEAELDATAQSLNAYATTASASASNDEARWENLDKILSGLGSISSGDESHAPNENGGDVIIRDKIGSEDSWTPFFNHDRPEGLKQQNLAGQSHEVVPSSQWISTVTLSDEDSIDPEVQASEDLTRWKSDDDYVSSSSSSSGSDHYIYDDEYEDNESSYDGNAPLSSKQNGTTPQQSLYAHQPSIMDGIHTSRTSLFSGSKRGNVTITELSLTIDGEVETFHCYQQK